MQSRNMTESVKSCAFFSLYWMLQGNFQILVCCEMKLLERLQAWMGIGPHGTTGNEPFEREGFTERKGQSR